MTDDSAVDFDVDTKLTHRGDIEIEFAKLIWPKIQDAVGDDSGLDALAENEEIRVTGELTVDVKVVD